MTDAPAPSAGWFEGADGVRRWWDGTRWTDGPVAPRPVVPPTSRHDVIGDDERSAILDKAVARYVRNGYVVQWNTGRQAVVVRRQRVNVLLNIALAVVTGGFWLVVLAVRLLNWPVDRVVLTVDDRGLLLGDFT